MLIGIATLLTTTTTLAAESRSGRWEGVLHLPGEEIQLIVDLDRPNGTPWVGSVIIPALHIKGATISDIVVSDSKLSFSVQEALGIPRQEQATFNAKWGAEGAVGSFSQGGNSAPFELARTGPPQVEMPPMSTPIDANLAGTWEGSYVLNDGRARHVTLTLENHGKAGATAILLIVGKEPHSFPIDVVTAEGSFVTVESFHIPLKIEGRLLGTGEIAAIVDQGPIEVPLVLHRQGKGSR